jgi:hypothetical protein
MGEDGADCNSADRLLTHRAVTVRERKNPAHRLLTRAAQFRAAAHRAATHRAATVRERNIPSAKFSFREAIRAQRGRSNG